MRKAGTAYLTEDGTLVIYFRDAGDDYFLNGKIALIDEDVGGASSGTMDDLDDTMPEGIPTEEPK